MIRRSMLLFSVLLFASAAAQPAQGPAQPRAPKNPDKMAKIMTLSASDQRPKSFLGIGVREVDSAVAKERGLAEELGVEVTRVTEDSAASRAGLQKGDVIFEYNGQPVQGLEQFMRLVRETPAGRKVTLKLNRDGKAQTVNATMGTCDKCGSVFSWAGNKDLEDLVAGVQLPTPPDVWGPQQGWFPDTPHVFTTWRSAKLGIEAESLESQLADFFGVKEGVLVRSVTKGSAAEKAGLRAGDVITKVGDAPVSKPRDITRTIRELNSTSLTMTVIREKREMTVTVTIDPSSSGGGGIQRLISDEITRL